MLDFLLIGLSVVIAIPSLVLFMETLAGVCVRPRSYQAQEARDPVTVIIPAHNEESGISVIIADVVAQLRAGDSVVVVADNCTDQTEEVARQLGATVYRRVDLLRRGKGFAIAYAIERVPEEMVVIIVDADCRLGRDAIPIMASAVAREGRPIQALYLMKPPRGMDDTYALAEFAWSLRNRVRPRGLRALGLSCQLQGSGMAFPAGALSKVNVASPNVVEDLELGVELAKNGLPPVFCEGAVVSSEFPRNRAAALEQRKRWEQGTTSYSFANTALLLGLAFVRRDKQLFALGLDLSVPPLSLLLVMLFGITTAGWLSFLALGGSLFAPALSSISLLSVALAVAVSAIAHGLRVSGTPKALLRYLFDKRIIYRGFKIFGPKEWVKTKREE